MQKNVCSYLQALISASYGPEGHVSLGSSYSEGTAVFFLELLLKVVIQNRLVFYFMYIWNYNYRQSIVPS